MVVIEKFKDYLILCDKNHFVAYNLPLNSSKFIEIPTKNPVVNPKAHSKLEETGGENFQKEISCEHHSRSTNLLAVSPDEQYLAIALENKNVIIYNCNFEVVKQFLVKRCPSKIIFSQSNDVVIADKTGEVYLYKLEDTEHTPELLLGHNSMVLDIVLSECGKFIITCDRDEKIRISRFPNSYNIESFCLGHNEFVISVKVCGNILISASGDGTIRFWDFVVGKQLFEIDTNELIKDSNLFEKFSQAMGHEKVDVEALPVTNMQILKQQENFVTIAVSIYKYSILQIFDVNLQNFDNVLTTLPIDEENFSFYLSSDLLFVLTKNRLDQYKIQENYKKSTFFNDLFEKYNDYFKLETNNSITILYKRKFDNVHDYLERKKVRLETSTSVNK